MTLADPLTHRIVCHNCTMSNCAHCERPARAKGLCNAHYKKLLKYGNPIAGREVPGGLTRLERYTSYVDQRSRAGCWPWTGGIDRKGYGIFAGDDGETRAHRYGFSQLKRPLKPGETVDHTCHNRSPDCPGGNTCPHRSCQNPAHWEAVTNEINQARGKSFSAVNGRKTHCNWGHELTPENSYGYKGRRQCKKCARLAARGAHPRQLSHHLAWPGQPPARPSWP